MSDNRPQYRVKIFPKGVRMENPPEVWLTFNSDVEQKDYVRDEYVFCRKEEKDHITAFYLKDRQRTKDALMRKRVEYAKKRGFVPANKGSNVWVQKNAA